MHYQWITLPDGTSAYVQVSDEPQPAPQAPAAPAPADPAAGHTCDICGKSFTTKLALSGHKRSH